MFEERVCVMGSWVGDGDSESGRGDRVLGRLEAMRLEDMGDQRQVAEPPQRSDQRDVQRFNVDEVLR